MWVDKYNPKSLSEFVFKDNEQKLVVDKWITDGSIPHILLSGHQGVGKSCLARLIIESLSVDPLDVLEINASRQNGIDTVKYTIDTFAQSIPFGDFKVIFLDEFDGFSRQAQEALRGLIEEYQFIVRFIITANYPNRILPPIRSRFQGFHVEKVNITEFTTRAATILVNENIFFELDDLDEYINMTYPDLRSCIHEIEQNTVNDNLKKIDKSKNSNSFLYKMIDLFEKGEIGEARKILCGNIRPDDVEDIFRWMYDHLEFFGDTPSKQDDAILIIKQGLVDHTLISDPEINLSGVLIQLTRNKNS